MSANHAVPTKSMSPLQSCCHSSQLLTVLRCTSYNCLDSQVCGNALNAPSHFSIWVYIVVCIGIFGFLFGALTFLFFVHRREREHEREKRMQYWREQVSGNTILIIVMLILIFTNSPIFRMHSAKISCSFVTPLVVHSCPYQTPAVWTVSEVPCTIDGKRVLMIHTFQCFSKHHPRRVV